jgi:hypothetical protein
MVIPAAPPPTAVGLPASSGPRPSTAARRVDRGRGPVVTVVNVLGAAFLTFAALVYVVVIAMCRAAGRADRSMRKSLAHSSDMIIDLDGIARGLTPPVGVRVPPVPTPRSGIPVVRPGEAGGHRPAP